VEPAAMDELLDDPGSCHPLHVLARLAELDAEALDLADPEASPDEIVQPHTAHDHLTAGLGSGESDVFQHLSLDQRQRLAAFRPLLVEVAVPFEALARKRPRGVDR